MSMSQAMRQMPASAGRAGAARGEAAREPASDEAGGPRREPSDTGNPHATLLRAAFTRENSSTEWDCLDSHDLNFSNRPVRTRMPGGVGGVRSAMIGPYPDARRACRSG